MRCQKLLPLLLLAPLAAAESLPLISNEAKHCLKPDICATVSVTSINSTDPALNKFADGLLNSAADGETAELYHFDKLDKAGLEAWIKRIATAELDAATVPNNDYSFDYVISQVGESDHYRVLRFFIRSYTGGAHGIASAQFYVLPKSGELKPVKLDDILLPHQRGRLDKLQEENFRRWLSSDGGEAGPLNEKELKEHFANFPFTANDNWRFDKRGLRFQYGQYEIAPYAMGMPEILVPTAQLTDVVKPEILQELASWQEQEAGEAQPQPQWRGAGE